MDIQITDGGGKGVSATVSTFKRLNVSAKTAPRLFYSSRDQKLSFNYTSVVSSVAAGDIIAYIKNTSTTRNLFIERIEFHSANAATYLVWGVTGTGSGTTVNPANLNRGSGLTAEADCLGDAAITGLTTVDRIATHRNAADGEAEMNFYNALILPPNSAIAIEYDTGTTGASEIDMLFHFENVGAG